MLTSHPTKRLRRRVAASLLVLGTATGAMVLPAGAVPQPVSSNLEGSLTTLVSTVTFPLTAPRAIFEGTWDPDTGAMEGTFLFPATSVDVADPAATVGVQVQQPVAGSGTVDLVTNEVTFSADLVLALLTLDVQGIGGNVAPCNYAMPITLTGTYDPVTGFVELSDDQFSLTAILEPNRCIWDGTGTSLATIIDAEIVSDANALDLTFDLGATDAEPPPPLACSDGLDNDDDGQIDLADPGCNDANDTNEADPAPPAAAPAAAPAAVAAAVVAPRFAG